MDIMIKLFLVVYLLAMVLITVISVAYILAMVFKPGWISKHSFLAKYQRIRL